MVFSFSFFFGVYVRLKHRVSQTSWVILGYSVTFEDNTGQPLCVYVCVCACVCVLSGILCHIGQTFIISIWD